MYVFKLLGIIFGRNKRAGGRHSAKSIHYATKDYIPYSATLALTHRTWNGGKQREHIEPVTDKESDLNTEMPFSLVRPYIFFYGRTQEIHVVQVAV